MKTLLQNHPINGILLIGNFLPSQKNSFTMAQAFSFRLQKSGYLCVQASSIVFAPLRLFDMLWITFWHRSKYEIAYVEVYSDKAFLWAEAVTSLLKLLAKPYVLTLHGGNLPVFAQKYAWRVERLLRSANRVTAPSPYLQGALSLHRPDILLIPNPIDVAQYPFRHRAIMSPRLIWLRAFHQIYHPQMALWVLHRLVLEFPDVHLWMIGPDKGDGSYQDVQRLAANLQLDGHLSLLPGVPKEQVPQILSQGDIFLNTTTVDNTPVSVVEALACGLCVVSTNVGGIPHLLEDEQDSLLVDSGDVQGMAEAVTRLLREHDLASRLSLKSRQKAENLDWTCILPKWEELFQELMEKDV